MAQASDGGIARSIYALGKFKGINEQKIIGEPGDSSTTRMRNCYVDYGRIIARNGFEPLGNTAIYGSRTSNFYEFRKDWTYSILTRASDEDIEAYVSNVWTSLLSAPFPVGGIISQEEFQNNLYFTWAGTPTVAAQLYSWDGITSTASVVVGAPAGRHIKNYAGFLMIGWIETPGFFPYQIRFSPDGVTWDPLDELDFIETKGGIRAMEVLGDALYVYKSDSIIRLRLNAGTRFAREVMPTDKGVLRHRTLVAVDRLGHIFLAPDKRLYLNNGSVVRHISAPVDETLKRITIAQTINAFATNDYQQGIYWLVIPLADGKENCIRLGYNWKSGEWTYYTYETVFTGGLAMQPHSNGAPVGNLLLFGDVDGFTYSMDVNFDDNGTIYYMDYETDWQMLSGPNQKYVDEVKMIWDKPIKGLKDVESYICTDFHPNWMQLQIDRVEGSNVDYGGGSHFHTFLVYKLQPPMLCNMFNMRIRLPVR